MLLVIKGVEILALVLLVSEVLLPWAQGSILFPRFRRKTQHQLLGQMEEARQELIEDSLRDDLARLRALHAEHNLGQTEEKAEKEETKEGDQ